MAEQLDMWNQAESDAKFMAEQINEKIARGVIRNAIVSDEGEFGFEVILSAPGRGNYNVTQVWVLRDAEGNGPGWLDIVE